MSETMHPAIKKLPNPAMPVRGQLHKFMLIPLMEHHTDWIEGGPVTFGVEARAMGDGKGNVGERGASLHVFNADRTEEYARFDCFQHYPHYHYILNDVQHNVLWGYDPDVNGPMAAWAVEVIRRRLPTILRHAGATALAERVEKERIDPAVLDRVEEAMAKAHQRTYPGADMIDEGYAWYKNWQKVHPQFEKVED